ncbi:MAG: asparaginase [Eubacterium sp.]|nr:asparaginase [Eubacterium sp.]
MNLLLVLTGGTIGTSAEADGLRKLVCSENGTDGAAEPLLLRVVYDRRPQLRERIRFTIREPYQVLSEHMTLSHLEKLVACLREEELSGYDGILITHGSDTLAYTAAFLGELMEGSPIPVFLLAAQRPPEDPESNGAENTLAALDLLRTFRFGADHVSGRDTVHPASEVSRGKNESEAATCPDNETRKWGPSPVYVPYRNGDGVMYLHYASELRQCEPGTDDFFSAGMQPVTKTEGGYLWPEAQTVRHPESKGQSLWPEEVRHPESKGESLWPEEVCHPEPQGEGSHHLHAIPLCAAQGPDSLWHVPDLHLTEDVLLLHPYVGIRYDCISLSGIRAVVHTLYHSSTAPKELVGFLDRCREAGVTCYILPCDPENYHYETTAELISHGAVPLDGLTEESAYMRLLMKKIQRNA